MKRALRRPIQPAALGVVLFLLAVVGVMAGPGQVTSAQAYPAPSCTVSIKPSTNLKPGQSFTVRGSSTAAVNWVLKFNGHTDKGHGKHFSDTLKAPTKPGHYSLSVRCIGASGSTTLLFTIHVSGGHAHQGGLPNTGGPSLWWWLAALAAIAIGILMLSYRRFRAGSPGR